MLPKDHLRLAKLRRALTSIPTADLLAAILVVIAIATIAVTLAEGNMTHENAPLTWVVLKAAIVTGVILITLLILKTLLEYRRRTYDPTLMFEFQKNFDLLEEARSEAADVCKAFIGIPAQSRNWETIPKVEQEKVEAVLDFLEDLGFYLQGDQFSDEVVHHTFYHWIRGWYSNLKSYVQYYRTVQNEMAAYEHIETLYVRISEIEKRYERPKLWLTKDQEKLDFLKEESENSED
jgi:uncharacterized integral membrane protein